MNSRTISEITYFRVSKNWLHDKWLRFVTRNKANQVVVPLKTFRQSYVIKPDINKSIRIEHTDKDIFVKPEDTYKLPDPHFREGYVGTLWGIKTLNYPHWYHRLWHKIWRKNNGK